MSRTSGGVDFWLRLTTMMVSVLYVNSIYGWLSQLKGGQETTVEDEALRAGNGKLTGSSGCVI